MKPSGSGTKVSGPKTPEKPKVLASGMYSKSSKYIPPQKRADWAQPTLLPKKKQVTFLEPHRTSSRFTQKPPVQLKKPTVKEKQEKDKIESKPDKNEKRFDQTQPPQFPVIHPPPQEISIEILHDQENNRPAFYDDDDDDDVDYTIAITPVLSTEEPNKSLSMGDEHPDTISDLVSIPSEFEGIPDTMCDVHLLNNPTPLEAKDHFEIVINSNDDYSSSDDDSLYNENIKYVEASPHDSELVSLEVAEIDILKDEEIEDDNLHEKLLKNLPDPGEWISSLNFGIRENLSSTTRVNLPVEDDDSPLLAYVLSVCYDDDDDEERSNSLKDNIIYGLHPCSAITPNEPVLSTEDPDNSLSMGDEHLDTIPKTESDEFIKFSVENLIPIPNESEDQFEDFSESNDEFSSTDDDSLSIDKIDYVEASPLVSELVSLEVMEIVIPEVGGIDYDILLTIKDEILREKLLNVNHLFVKIEALNDNPNPFFDPIISGTPLTLTPSGESDFFLEEVDAFLAVGDEPISSQFPQSYLDPEGDILLLEAFLNDDHSSDFKTKSSSTSLNSLLEETNNFDNSLTEFITFSNVYFDAEYESDSSDDQSYSDEDVPEKIFLTLLFDEEIIPMKIDQHYYNAKSNLMESLHTNDSSHIILSKIDSLLDEFAGELTLLKSIPLGIDETDCDFEEDILLIEKLFNKTAKGLWDALERQMRGSEYGEQDRKAAILYGDVNDTLGYKKKAVVVTSDPLA
nr:hypothetical protein [Tanacetum cinerariifolium]